MSATDTTPTIAFVGLGNMGIPMATRLIEAGHLVIGIDTSDTARAQIVAAGAECLDDSSTAAHVADIIILMLPNSTVVGTVVAAMLERPGRLRATHLVDMSSSEPVHSRALAEKLASRGVSFVDAPVSGGVGGAVAGTLTVMAGGSADSITTLGGLLETFGTVRHVGPVGAGHAMKALNNLVSATHLWITSEAVHIGAEYGIEPQTVIEVLNGSSGRSGSSQAKWPNFILTGHYNSGFTAQLMLKDIRIATDLARHAGRPTSLGDELESLWQHATNDLPRTADHTEIAAWLGNHPEPAASHPDDPSNQTSPHTAAFTTTTTSHSGKGPHS